MSPLTTCSRHGRARCALCKAARQRRQERRDYSDTARYRAMSARVLETYGDACIYCRERVGAGDVLGFEPGRAFVLAHHPIAHADGGPFELENLRPAHRDCNLRAGRGSPPPDPQR